MGKPHLHGNPPHHLLVCSVPKEPTNGKLTHANMCSGSAAVQVVCACDECVRVGVHEDHGEAGDPPVQHSPEVTPQCIFIQLSPHVQL